jgi:4-amino-4-deoxy-L-arabinose transferase-like glycosyltransferase
MMITQNEFTKGGVDGLKKILHTDAFAGYLGEGKSLLSGGRYRPLTQWIFNLEYSAYGLNPKLWHIQNTLFFAIAMVLLYLTLFKLFNITNPKLTNLAYISTLIAVVHPLNTEVVANIKSFDLLLSLLLSLTALFWSLSYYQNKKNIYLVGIFVSLFLGILAKETALTFLGVIPLSILFFRKIDIK